MTAECRSHKNTLSDAKKIKQNENKKDEKKFDQTVFFKTLIFGLPRRYHYFASKVVFIKKM
jgi:hypothetical protein